MEKGISSIMQKSTKKKMPFSIVITIFIIIVFILFSVSFLIGRYPIGPTEVFKILFSKIIPFEVTWSDTTRSVVMDIRIPRIILALLVGAGLSVSGAAFQGIFQNPLVSPDLMGVSSASGFGATLAIMLSLSMLEIRSFAFIFGILGVAMAYFLSRTHKTTPTIMLVLSGTVVSSLFDAGISILKYMADPEEKLPAITFWLMGSLSSSRWDHVRFALPTILISIILLCIISWRINLLSMGDAEAKSLGVHTERLKAIVILLATLITATCVYVSGTIRWVGLMIPHIARIFVGPDNRKLFPTSALLGGIFLLLIDDLARTLSESAIPLGILTSLIGAPFFAILIRQTKGDWNR